MVPIRIFLVDKYSLVRSGVASVLQKDPGLQTCGEAATIVESITKIKELNPDIVIVDIFEKGGGGIDSLKELYSSCPGIKVIVLTDCNGEIDFLNAIRSGVKAYLSKGLGSSELINSIYLAASGGTVVHGLIGTRLFVGMQSQDRNKSGTNGLSSREKEILKLVALGNSNREIAASIYVSETTVKSHVRRILDKLGVKNRTQAVTSAIDKGLLDQHIGERDRSSPSNN